MQKLTFLMITIITLVSCGPSLQVTNLNTHTSQKIKVRKINAIILNDGQVLTENIQLGNGSLFSNGMPVNTKEISTLEIKQTKFGEVISFPLVMIGALAAGGGGVVIGAAIGEEDPSDMGNQLIIGGLLLGTGIGINRLGHAMRPSDKKLIKSLNASEYHFETPPNN